MLELLQPGEDQKKLADVAKDAFNSIKITEVIRKGKIYKLMQQQFFFRSS